MSALGKYLKGETNMPNFDMDSIIMALGKLTMLRIILGIIF